LNRQDRIKKLLKPSNLLILGFATIIYLTICIFQIVALVNKTYVLTKSDLVPIDSVRMLSRAYIIGGGKSSSKSIEFDDETYKTFWITSSRYLAVNDFSMLYDTLQYSDLVMKLYTDKEGYNNYFDKNNKDKIEVYGIEVGNTSFIPLDDINKEERGRRTSILIFFTIAYFIFVLVHFVRIWRTTKSVQNGLANIPADE
jgi:hypothetical protein